MPELTKKPRTRSTTLVLIQDAKHELRLTVSKAQVNKWLRTLEREGVVINSTVEREKTVSADEVFKALDEKYTRPGVALRGARGKEGLSQAALAKKLGITQGNLSKMENGTRTIGKAMAKRLAAVLKIDYRVFL